MDAPLVALLGRQEKPTDGIEDYCRYLAAALARQSVTMETARFKWDEVGWISALRELRRRSSEWRGRWVVVHYTALAWSRRGFPLGVLVALAILRRRGVRCAVLFHEPVRQGSPARLRDKLRGAFQEWMIRNCFRNAQRAIFTVPLETIAWLPRNRSRAVYIPIGANIPERVLPRDSSELNPSTPKTVAVFCLSLGENRLTEIADLAHAAERVRDSVGAVRFVVLGKGSAEAREEIESAISSKDVEMRVLGRLPAVEVANTLATADVLLYLGGHVTQTRGSALAGVACGLPIVGYTGAAREPIYDAGVELAPYGDREALATALVRVLKDNALRSDLRRRSSAAQRSFSWKSIADAYIEAFELGRTTVIGIPNSAPRGKSNAAFNR